MTSCLAVTYVPFWGWQMHIEKVLGSGDTLHGVVSMRMSLEKAAMQIAMAGHCIGC